MAFPGLLAGNKQRGYWFTVGLDLTGDTNAVMIKLRSYSSGKRLWDVGPETAGAFVEFLKVYTY
jgi:hypothetical protein